MLNSVIPLDSFDIRIMNSQPMQSIDALMTRLAVEDCFALANETDTKALMQRAVVLREQGFSNTVSYSKKVFIPLTHLCRDVCHYCTFAQTPKFIQAPYLSVDEVLKTVKEAEDLGCKEALFTLGERPELRYQTAAKALAKMGFSSTIDYLAHVAAQVREHTTVLPHVNPGTLSLDELYQLRKVSASMGIMLESASKRLCEKGMPHYGSPDKDPDKRLETIRLAGVANIPFTTGILIGIGETRLERIESLLAIRDIHDEFGHIQEIIIQNFKAKPDTKMVAAPEPDLNELLWTLAVTRLIFGASMSIQVPPNLSPGVLPQLIDAGINDWGGVSPVTPDFVNPEAPWPEITTLAEQTGLAGKHLIERMTIYPSYIQSAERWLDSSLVFPVKKCVDADGWPKEDAWQTGISQHFPATFNRVFTDQVSEDVALLLASHQVGDSLMAADIVRLFQAKGADFQAVCAYADQLRHKLCGNDVTYVVNRNINYTNICYFNCKFCAFSKGKTHEGLRGKPYEVSLEEVGRRVREAYDRGATEVTLQGGIHPNYDGNTYIDICKAVKSAVPEMHIHGFTPLEIWQGASTLGVSIENYLYQLKACGLGTIPGTAAEILCDDVRADLCSDKINSEQWLYVMEEAHKLGIKSTATIMFGHIEHYHHWAQHLIKVRELQKKTGGFTELVPLPFVANEAPIFLREQSRSGPSLRESMLMHAVSRIVLSGFINNIQASWVKLGVDGAKFALQSGANDVGGTLMNETITRSAGAKHGQEMGVQALEALITSIQRKPVLRNTVYEHLSAVQRMKASHAQDLSPMQFVKPDFKGRREKR